MAVTAPTNRWPTALVTGASSGIGLEMSRQLAADGSSLVIVARTETALNELAVELDHKHGTNVEILVADLSTSDGMTLVEDRLTDRDRPVDLLVNNAGYGLNGGFWTRSADEHQQMLELNVIALTRLARAAVKPMFERGRGGILNVSSISGFVPSYGYATYGASKSYVTSFTEVLHEELRGSGVHVSCLAPGFTRTQFQATSGNEAEGLPDFMWQAADDVARAGLAAVAKNRAVWVPGAKNQAMVGFLRLIPRPIQRRVASRVVDQL